MQRIERLATIGQVAGGIAHELRNPLNVIRTSVYYLRTTQKLTPEKLAQHLDRIEKQVGLGDSVITALSNFARMPLPDLTAVPLAEFFREVLDRSPVPEKIEVRIEIPGGLPPASADRNQLEIVFGNLIRNACDAMPDGGRLTIEAVAEHEGVSVVIRDTGHGIAPEHQKRVMEPFFSTKARGIGLGLALSRAILERNSGQLSVQSSPGQGAAFTVKLPAARSVA
jgi:signal transduction histidine kinase